MSIVRSTRSWRASKPHPLFRVAIPRVNFSRWQPFSIAESGNLPLPFARKRYPNRRFFSLAFSAVSNIATNSRGLYRIGSTYTTISTACNASMRSIIELGVTRALKGQPTWIVSKDISTIEVDTLCNAIPGIKRSLFLRKSKLQFCQRIFY